MRLIIFLLFSILGLTSIVALAKSDSEHQKQLQKIEERYDDFFRRLEKKEALDKERRSSSDEHKAHRKKQALKRNQYRADFIKKRKQKASKEPLKKKHEEKKLKRLALKAKTRRDFALQKSKIQKTLESTKRIPPEKEFDLEKE